MNNLENALIGDVKVASQVSDCFAISVAITNGFIAFNQSWLTIRSELLTLASPYRAV